MDLNKYQKQQWLKIKLKLIQKNPQNPVFFHHFWATLWGIRNDKSTEMTYMCQSNSLSFPPGTFKAKWLQWFSNQENNSEHWTFDRNHFGETEMERINLWCHFKACLKEKWMLLSWKRPGKKTPLFRKDCDQRRNVIKSQCRRMK